MKSKVEKEPEQEPKVDLVKARKEGLELIQPIQSSLGDLVIITQEDYLQADELLTRIVKAEKHWLSLINPPIESINQGLNLLYALRKDIAEPLAKAKARVKDEMKTFKLKEAQAKQEEERKRQEEIERLQEEARKKEEALNKAKSPQFKGKLTQQVAEAQQKASELAAEKPQESVRAAGSVGRKTKKWRITDLPLFIAHTLSSEDLIGLVQVNQVELNSYFRLQEPAVGKWMPGVEVYEDIDIATRGR